MKKKDQISFDEETAKRLQTEFDEEERLAREKDEANVALTKEWDDFQAFLKSFEALDYTYREQKRKEEQTPPQSLNEGVSVYLSGKQEGWKPKCVEEPSPLLIFKILFEKKQ
ncbi:hypothetical protein Tco_0796593 [Tanacetum coccineum]